MFTGSGRTILAPRYGHRFSAGGDASATEVNEGTLGVYAAWLPTPRLWLAVEPEVVFDVERDETRGSVATECGTLLLDTVGTYVRPRIGLGSVSARPYDWSIEFGFRIIP